MLETGIKFIEGIPGSGKSWIAVEILLDQIINHRRPVYTNLPMRDANLRRYLKRKTPRKTDNYANLYHDLSQDHMFRFTERAGRLARIEEQWRASAADLCVTDTKTADFHKWYAKHHPDDKPVLIGKDANWLPTGSVLIIDEARRWFPMSGAKRDPVVEDYASMHRHHYHLVHLIAQDCMQVSLSFREKACEFTRVDNAADEKVFAGLTLARLKLSRGFARYTSYTKEGWEDARSSGGKLGKPTSYRLIRFNSKPHIFTLYNSHTQSGVTPRAAHRLQAKIANEAGVEPAPFHSRKRRKRTKPRQRSRRLRRNAIRVALIAAPSLAAYAAGRNTTTPTTQTTAPTPNATNTLTQPSNTIPPPVRMIGDGYARFGDTRYALGDTIQSWILFNISHGDGYAVLVPLDNTADDAWLCVPGKPHESLGPGTELLARIRDEARRSNNQANTTPDQSSVPSTP